MTLDEIHQLWAADCEIDDIDIDQEARNIPKLHSKYLKILSTERLKLAKIVERRVALRRTLADYYHGDLNNPEDLAEINREPWKKTVLKGDIDNYVNADKSTIKINIMWSEQQEVVKTLESILKSINDRGFLLRDIIEWRKLTQFGGG